MGGKQNPSSATKNFRGKGGKAAGKLTLELPKKEKGLENKAKAQ